jgi:hypothetical protein
MQACLIYVSFVMRSMTPEICCASYLVGVITKHRVLFGNGDFNDRFISSEIMGAANASVLPEPVCEAIRNS